MPKIVAIMPIKLNNERLPGKNTKILGDKPLLRYELDTLLKIEELESINVYCSDISICEYLPEGINFIERPKFLDLPESNFTQIFECFMSEVDADIYVYAHATAPFVKLSTIRECIEAVLSETLTQLIFQGARIWSLYIESHQGYMSLKKKCSLRKEDGLDDRLS